MWENISDAIVEISKICFKNPQKVYLYIAVYIFFGYRFFKNQLFVYNYLYIKKTKAIIKYILEWIKNGN